MSKFGALALEVDAPARMTINHPNTGLPIRDAKGDVAWIDLYSNDSQIAVKARRLITNSRLRMRNRDAVDAERLEIEGTELLADLTVGWNLLAPDGSKIDVPYSRQNAIELYSDHAIPWLREQVDTFVGNRANFSRASSTTSSLTPSKSGA